MLSLLPLLLALVQAPVVASVQLDEAPSDLRLYPRDASGFGTVVVRGSVTGGDWDEIVMELTGEDGVATVARQPLPRLPAGSPIPFALTLPIRAICVDHQALLLLRAGTRVLVA